MATGCTSTSEPTGSSSSSSPGQQVKAVPIKTEGLTKGSVCKITLSEAQQKTLGVWKAEPMDGKGETSCYFSMTPDTANAAGYVVSLFENEEALLGTADATGASSTKAVPVSVKTRTAARQVMFGKTWKSSLVVDIGAGRFLYVERYSPMHVVTEQDLNSQALKVAEQVLANLEGKGNQGT
uniref:DUF3558 domain-containing protein n=1 Tax=Streptomyces sp. NBC_00003 TaxID=2903608 RepID=A0AAU2V6Z0_9ACTN